MGKTKKCTVCGEEKPLTSEYFQERKDSKDGYRNNCRKCSGKKAEKYNPPEGLKRCNRCARDLPANTDYFFLDNSREDGFQYRCKECKGHEFTNKVCKEGYKICQVCFKEKPMTEKYFRKREEGKNGFDYRCKACEFLSKKKWMTENDARYKKYVDNYQKQNKEMLLIKAKEYRDNNPEKRKQTSKKYYENNKNEIAEYRKKYYKENKEKIRGYIRKWRQENPEKRRIQEQRYRAAKAQLPNTLTNNQWGKILKDFNNSCAYCGMTEKEHKLKWNEQLHQDHFIAVKNGGEYAHNNIIPACKSCNSSKNDKDFFEWYLTYEHYDTKREQFILEYLGYTTENAQQLSIL